MTRAGIVLALILGNCGCISTQVDDADPDVSLSAKADAADVAWRFDFVDVDQKPLGFLVLVFSEDRVDEPTCGNDHWSRMPVVENGLDFDFGVEFRPAYTIHGPWLTIDLTSSVCYLDHMLIGNIAPDGVSGFFNLSHKIGGENIGKFTARPVSRAETTELPGIRD